MPRKPRKKNNIDVSRFEPLVQEALKAFGTHPDFAEQMSKAAVTVMRKRSIWQTRSEVAKVEVQAQQDDGKEGSV